MVVEYFKNIQTIDLSQHLLASKLKLTKGTISEWEKTQVHIQNITSIKVVDIFFKFRYLINLL